MKFSILFYGDETTTTTKKSIGGNGELPKKTKRKHGKIKRKKKMKTQGKLYDGGGEVVM